MATKTPENAKQQIQAILDRLPEDCSIEEVQYRLYVLGKISRGIESGKNGEFITQAEMERRVKQWFAK